eukprot:Em0022g531a
MLYALILDMIDIYVISRKSPIAARYSIATGYHKSTGSARHDNLAWYSITNHHSKLAWCDKATHHSKLTWYHKAARHSKLAWYHKAACHSKLAWYHKAARHSKAAGNSKAFVLLKLLKAFVLLN